ANEYQTGHTGFNDDRVARFETQHNTLANAVDLLDDTTHRAATERGQRGSDLERQPGAAQLVVAGDRAAFGCQDAAPHGFYFREFRHRESALQIIQNRSAQLS